MNWRANEVSSQRDRYCRGVVANREIGKGKMETKAPFWGEEIHFSKMRSLKN